MVNSAPLLPVGLQIQRLAGGFNQQVLVLLQVACSRNDSASASPTDVANVFKDLQLPPPSNERQHLVQLKKKHLVMQPSPGTWAVTPEGREEIRRLMSRVTVDELERIGEKAGEPVFAGAAHHRVLPSMAPALFEEGISRFLQDHPGDRNVFIMTRYPKDDDSYELKPSIDLCRDSLRELGMVAHLASDSAVHDQLFANVGVYLWSCDFGLAILEEREKELNYSVVLETGAMLVTGRRCLLLKDKSVKRLPTDLIAHIHKEVDLDKLETVRAAIREWVTADLGLA